MMCNISKNSYDKAERVDIIMNQDRQNSVLRPAKINN